MKPKYKDYVYRLGWDRIYGKKGPRGAVYLLPSEANGVIVQYDPVFRISCLIPPKTRKVVTDWGGNEYHTNVDCPFLILSQLFCTKRNFCQSPECLAELLGLALHCQCDECQAAFATITHPPVCHCKICRIPSVFKHRVRTSFYIYSVNTAEKDDIVAQPYRISGNVYEDALICFKKNGRSTIRWPKTLREAHATFWMHRFDNDFNWKIPHSCDKKIHTFENCKKRKKRVHKCRRGRNHAHYAHTCENKPHKLCLCCHRTCYCFELCACCMKACDCEKRWPNTCDCPCCTNICHCACRCDLTQDFAELVASKGAETPPDKWEIYTAVICGEQFFASTKKATGVFISYDKEFMENIPKKFWRRGRDYPAKLEQTDLPFIVGIVNPGKDDTWEVDLGEFQFILKHDQATLIG